MAAPAPGPGAALAAGGLTHDQVCARTRAGRLNVAPGAPTRTFGQIVRANLFTPVNGIIGGLLVVILIARPGPDALFAGVVVANTLVGIVQELRAKRALERLAVLSAPQARVVRDGEPHEVPYGQVVADEVIDLRPGDQAAVDGVVLVSDGLEVNEALLTGEADPVVKVPGDEVLSGSFVVAGAGRFQATRIGDDAYAITLTAHARRFQLVDSELRAGVNRVLRWLTWVIPPVAILLTVVLWNTEFEWRDALRGTVAAMVAMVPDGLVLLTSIAFIVGVLQLARHRALARELAAVELLARVDVLCLDKTGTLTTGELAFAGLEPLAGVPREVVARALAAVAAAEPNPNATLTAIAARFPVPPAAWRPTSTVAFSSTRRYGAVSFAGRGTYLLGAPEALLTAAASDTEPVRQRVAEHARNGHRVLLLAWSARDPVTAAPVVPSARPGPQPLALVVLSDQVRPDAPEILAFLASQGIALKVISGDHPATTAAVARRAGLPGAEAVFDARDLPDDPGQLADVMARYRVFGRVRPFQKQAMVAALRASGATVAMTGDGVNDVLALKDAELGIAMGSGSDATRAVAEVVLLDNRFATLPVVLAAGRRVINNIERVANLFLVKATYALLLTVLTVAFTVEFPFLPRHLTLVSVLSIGVPGFVLAMAPDTRRAVPGFIQRVLRFSVPAGLVAGTVTFLGYVWLRHDSGHSLIEARSAATLLLLGVGLVVLVRVARPLNWWKVLLVAGMLAGYLVVLYVPVLRHFYLLTVPTTEAWLVIIVGTVAAAALLALLGILRPVGGKQAGRTAVV